MPHACMMDLVSSDESEGDDRDIVEWLSEDEETSSGHHVHTKGDFFGVYLLVSLSPKFKGRTYIGFTVNPSRRIRQHNSGHQKGGAKKTSGRGPWEMILIVHGFPTDISALRFEWAWQHPNLSRRLRRTVARRKPKETPVQFRVRVLAEMLSVGPWCRLPLTVRWLKPQYEVPFPLGRQPPVHMPVAYGPIGLTKEGSGCGGVGDEGGGEEKEGEGAVALENAGISPCCVCSETTPTPSSPLLFCYHDVCSMSAHPVCLAPRLCEEGHLLPICGPCPRCGRTLLWGELVRRSKVAERREKAMEACHSQPPSRTRRSKVKAPGPNHWTEALHVPEND